MSDGRLNFKATIDDADFNRKLNNMEKGVDGLNFNTPTKSLDGLNKKLLETKQRLQESKNELKRLNAQISTTAPGAVKNNLLGERNALSRSINEDKAAVIGYKQEITNLNRELGNTAKGSNTLKNTLSSLTRYFGALLGIGTVINLLRSFYDTTKQLQVLNKSMELGAKDSQAYASNISFLKDITEQYGLELISTSQAYNKFYTASKNKLGLGEIQLIFEKVSKASSLMGMSVADQAGVFRALEQMMSKGKVQAEELRMQLGDRLPGAFEIMAKATGVSTAELDKLMKDGKVIASDVLPKFAIELEKAFGADKVNMIDNIAASENRLKNAWTDLVENINNGNGIITKSIMLFYDFSSGILSLINPSKTLTETLSDEQIGLNSLIGRITDVNIKNSERLILIEELKSKYPAYVRNIGEENLSNQELRNSLASVNDEYSKRILLQKEIDNLNSAVAQKDSWEAAVLQNQIDLYEELIAINTKYNLGLEITPTNAYEMADKVQLAARKNISAYQQLKIEALQTDYNTFSKNAELASKNVDNVRKAYEELLRVLGVKTPTQIAQEESIYAYNRKLDEALTKAKGLGGKVGKDFNEFDLTGVNNYIKKIEELSTKQTSSNKKIESLAKKRMDFIFSLQKAENDLTQSTLSGLDLEKAKIEEVYQDRLKKAKELGANQEALNKIESLRDRETETVTYKADTEALKTSLEQQKKDYEDFENYKKQVGVEKAKEMYAGIIDVSKSYYDVLRDELNNIDLSTATAKEKERYNALFKMFQEYSISKKEEERKNFETLISMTQSYEQKILNLREEYEKKKSDLRKDYTGDDLDSRLDILDKEYQEKASNLINEFADEKGFGTAVTQGVIGATKQIIVAQIESLRSYLKNAKDLTKNQVNEIEKIIKNLDANLFKASDDNNDKGALAIVNSQIKSLQQSLKELEERKSFLQSLDLPETNVELALIESQMKAINVQIKSMAVAKAKAIGDEFSKLSGIFSSLAGDFEAMGGSSNNIFKNLSKVANIAGTVSNLFADMKAFNEAQKTEGGASFSQTMSAAGGLMSAVFGISGMIMGIFDDYEKAQRAAEMRRIDSYIKSLDFERELAALETERLRRNAISISDRQKEADSVNREILLKVKQLEEIQQRLNNFSFFYLMRELQLAGDMSFNKLFGDVGDIQAYYDKLKEMRDLGQEMTQQQKEQLALLDAFWLGNRSWEELQQVLNNLKGDYLHDTLRPYVEQAIQLAKELEEAGYTLEDVQNMIREMSTGTSVDELSNKLADAFAKGEDAAISFADTIEDVLKNAIISSFKNEYIVKEMDAFFKKFGDMGADGYTDEELDKIRQEAQEMAERLQKQWDALYGSLEGFDFGSDELGGSMKDGIKRITESQADRLTGILTGMQVDVIESRKSLQLSNNLLSSSLDNLIAIEFNTRATADNTYQLVQILQNNQQKALGL